MGGDTILTCGTFDLFHQGHLNLLKSARKMGKKLIVGVSSDFFNISKKNKLPISPLYARYKLITELKCVDQVFIEDDISLEAKARYMQYYSASIFVIGDDWYGKFDDLPYIYEKLFPNSKISISVIYLPRTKLISTTSILDKAYHRQEINYKKYMIPKPNATLLNVKKLPYKVIFNCRNRAHQAVHLLPYFYCFEKHNVYWYIENITDEKNSTSYNYNLNKIIKSINNCIGFDIDESNIVTSLQEVSKLDINLAIFTELWKPIVLCYKKLGIKVYFIDHGICVGTRLNSWFANVWQNDVDKIIVSGQMQYDHHKHCSKLPECHSKKEEDIYMLHGYPKLSLFNPCEWIWNINSKTNLKRILIAPTSFYDNYSFILNNITRLCRENVVIIRPHPDTMEMANPFGELFKIFTKCVDDGCAENLIIIPPNNNFLTMNLFTCDMGIFDQSSVAYEYLLMDKPGLITSLKLEESATPDIRNTFSQIDPSVLYNIDKLYFILRDPLHLKEKRKKMKEYVFGSNNDNWINNFMNLVNEDLKDVSIKVIDINDIPSSINYDHVDNTFYYDLDNKNIDIIPEEKNITINEDSRNINININISMEDYDSVWLNNLIKLVNQKNEPTLPVQNVEQEINSSVVVPNSSNAVTEQEINANIIIQDIETNVVTGQEITLLNKKNEPTLPVQNVEQEINSSIVIPNSSNAITEQEIDENVVTQDI